MAEATRRKVYDMLAADRMMVQGFHYPFPARAYIEKTSTGYRETMVPWSPMLCVLPSKEEGPPCLAALFFVADELKQLLIPAGAQRRAGTQGNMIRCALRPLGPGDFAARNSGMTLQVL